MILFFLGCIGTDYISITGHIMEGPQSTTAVSLASVTAYNEQLETQSISDNTDEYGAFEVMVPSLESFYLKIEGEDRSPTFFAGQAGAYDMGITDGAIFSFSNSYLDDLKDKFSTCGDVEGGIIEGEVVVAFPSGGNDYVSNAWVTAYDELENKFEGCYLDDNGNYIEDALYTGKTGRFAIFGLEDGIYSLSVAYGVRAESDEYQEEDEGYYWNFRVLIQDSGIAPFYPAWVEPN